MSAKYGHVIISTPGLQQDGGFPLAASGLQNNEVAEGFWLDRETNEPVAVFATAEAAEAAMMRLVPEGSNPGVFAGLSVASAFECCPTLVAHGCGLQGMDGFVVPQFDC